MNIALIVIDTLRYDYIGANGNTWIETPNIDRFASKAWAFDRAFCASFPTIPYRTDVITGQYGTLSIRGSRCDTNDRPSPRHFFLWVDCFDPHEPWDAPLEFIKKYDARPDYDGRVDPRSLFGGRNDKDLPDEAKEHIKAQYPAKLTWMDHCFGQFLDALESTGLDGNTAVILTGDHGTNVGERGTFGKGQPVREAEAHVPLFIRMPDGDTGRSDVIVQPQDFFSTILALLGETEPEGIEGYDILTPARRGEAGERQLALAGGSLERWNQAGQNPNFVLFTAFDKTWSLEVAAKPEHSHLARLGSLDCVEKAHPEIVTQMHAAAIDELERRGTDPGLIAWLRNGGEGELPANAQYWDGYRALLVLDRTFQNSTPVVDKGENYAAHLQSLPDRMWTDGRDN